MRAWVFGLAMLALTACTPSTQSGAEIKNAWSPAAPPGAAAIAVYAQVVVHQDDTLLRVSSSRASVAQIHSTVEEGGMMRMRQLEKLDMKRGEVVSFQPGGMHLMLMGLKQPLVEGKTFEIELLFEVAGPRKVKVAVRGS